MHATVSLLLTKPETDRLRLLFERQCKAFQAYPSPSAEDRLQWRRRCTICSRETSNR